MYEKWLKRGIDFLIALIGIMVLILPMAFIAVLIKMDSPGPVFFQQKRIGKHKQFFSILKFRSMRVDAPHDAPTHQLQNATSYITPIGAFLRKTSLDELPQLINILKGDMAVVGPRPALWNQDDLISERDRYGANDVRPGLTGWAQINGRDELEIAVKSRLDGEYVKILTGNSWKAFIMDVKCIFRTAAGVLRSEGVVEGGTGEMHKREMK